MMGRGQFIMRGRGFPGPMMKGPPHGPPMPGHPLPPGVHLMPPPPFHPPPPGTPMPLMQGQPLPGSELLNRPLISRFGPKNPGKHFNKLDPNLVTDIDIARTMLPDVPG